MGQGADPEAVAPPFRTLEIALWMQALKAKLAEALSQVAELQRDKADYLPLLESYWVANEALRDQQSEAATSWQTKLALSEMRAQKVLSEKAKVEKQFKQLYREKYLPLKEHFAASKEAVEKLTAQHSAAAAVMEQLRSQLATAELKLRKAGIDQQSTLQQLAQAQDLIQAQGQTIVERDNALAEAAKALEQMRAQAGRAAVYQAEVEALATQNGLLQQKMDEAVHRVNAVKQARDRATQGMLAKEEEICDLQVKLRERDVKLAELKRETERFAESKQRCKGEAAAYEAKLQEKATENAMLLKMCDQLMTEMEKAGMAVPM
ncbi:hypothetical protein WJX72_008703 [[Myrmecia] bisecta]|uniref:Uncharacterized protein n=1 Tax=[Myrmecia] bisecta TaxID=41462 RepID=A0AAW1Q1H0_9CHLO